MSIAIAIWLVSFDLIVLTFLVGPWLMLLGTVWLNVNILIVSRALIDTHIIV
jgi:hypothetical protein